MQMTPETILVPMMNGTSKPRPVLTFTVRGVQFSAQLVSSNLTYILHRDTGLKVESEWTGDLEEAAIGFRDAVRVGAYNVAPIVAAASQSAQINVICAA